VIVTHPFHPLAGRRVEVLYAKRRGGTRVLVCDAGAGRTMTLPVEWTDRGPAAETLWLGVDGLIELHVLVNTLMTHCDDPDRGGSS
jgi:hypothetical protein